LIPHLCKERARMGHPPLWEFMGGRRPGFQLEVRTVSNPPFALYSVHAPSSVGKAKTMRLLRNQPFLLLVVTALLTTGAASLAQQDGDVTVIIKAKSKTAALPTLLVMCDLVCNWKLDGVAKGHIDAGGSAKVKVESGQHMVEATTEDGVDQAKQPTMVKPTGQTMVNLEFQPIRDARLSAEQDAMDKAAQEAQAKIERESRGQAEQEARDRSAQERAAKEEAERQPWTDPATGLMWTKTDNGSSVSWDQATYYCRNLKLAGHNDWRLPTINELSGIKENEANAHGVYLKGDLQLELDAWSSSQVLGKKGKATDMAWVFGPSPYGPKILGVFLVCEGCEVHALCVRGRLTRRMSDLKFEVCATRPHTEFSRFRQGS